MFRFQFAKMPRYFYSITKGQQKFYNDNGYLIVENAVTKQQIEALKNRTDQMIEEADIIKNQIFFTANNKDARGISFLDTASGIGYLLEQGSLDERGNLKVPNKKMALNKIGHAMHDIDPVYKRFSYNKVFQGVLSGLGYVDPILVQSMFIFKNQSVGTKVDCHTDNSYIISEPKLSCMGMWIALEDASRENGCMFAFPGSHKTPTEYFLKLNKDRKTTSYHGPEPNYTQIYDVEKAACLEVPKGTLICLHGDLVHYSGHNHSALSRHAYTMHFIEAGLGNKWSEDAWLQREPQLPFRKYNDVVKEL